MRTQVILMYLYNVGTYVNLSKSSTDLAIGLHNQKSYVGDY